MIIQSKNVWLNEQFAPAQLELENGKIKQVLAYGEKKADVDYGEDKILPGLVDIHNHGYMGRTSNNATPEWLREWVAYLPSEGVTSILATTSTSPLEAMLPSFEIIRDMIKEQPKGATILGINSEGPLISKEFKGAQNENYLVKPEVETFKHWQELAGGNIIYVTIAPEKDDNFELIKYCAETGVATAAGHTGAKFKDIEGARTAGLNSFTHTYNGMRGLHHREPGVLGAAMYFDDLYAELIADNGHVDNIPAYLLAKLKGKDKLILITDAVAIKGMPVGEYGDGFRKCTIGEDGIGRLADGTLAGSSNKLNKVLMNAIENAGIEQVVAINAATINPLTLLKVENKGLIKEGYDADITVLDKNYDAVQTYVNGEAML